jgi:PAS domain S-box-containing protein
MRHLFDRRVIAWFVAATAMSLALGVVLFAAYHQLSKQASWVGHTQEALLALRYLGEQLEQATVAVRGFALTGEDRSLAPYARCRPLIAPGLRWLGDLIADNPDQQRRLLELEPLIQRRLDAIDHIVALRRARGIEPVIEVLRSHANDAPIERIREILAALQAEEDRLLHLRMSATTRASHRTLAVFVAGMITNMLILTLAFGYLGRQMVLRDRAEDTLRRGEKRFRDVFDAAAVGMAVVAPDGRWIEVNPSFCGTVGYGPDELLAMDSASITHPEDRELEGSEWGRLLGMKVDCYRLEKRYVHKSGRSVYTSLSVSMVRDSSGRPLHLVAMIEDITERKRAESRLAAQHAAAAVLATSVSLEQAMPRLLRAVGEAMGLEAGQFWRPDPSGETLRASWGWCTSSELERSFGVSASGLAFARGRGLPGRVWADGRPRVIEDVARDPDFVRTEAARTAGLRGAMGLPVIGAGGEWGVVTFLGREVVRDDQSLRSFLATLGRQIGLFADRLILEEASHVGDRRLRAVFDQTVQFIGLLDPRGTLLEANRSALEFAGVSRGDVDGRPFWDGPWWTHPPGIRPRVRAAVAEVAKGSSVRFEVESTGHDGRTITMDFSLTPVVDEVGRVVLLLATGYDITDRRRAAEAQREAREAAEAASRLKGQFLANVSHEIRTPMNAILGMTELTLDTDLSDDQREYLEIVKSATDSLLSIVDDLLDFSKLEAGKLELDPVEFRLRDSLGDTLDMLALRAHLKGLELSCRIAPEVPDRLIGDPARLRQIIANLVGNAIKFTPSGDVVVGVDLVTPGPESGGIELHFRVADTGIGIPSSQQERIFAPFTQADGSTTRLYGGTGLGLGICSQLVAMMGGAICLESEVGRGSTFHFTARFLAAGSDADDDRPEPGVLDDLRGLNILVVDDNAINRRIVAEMLAQWGARPTLADGPAAALEALERCREAGTSFALVLLDVQMPGMEGFTLAERVKADPGHGGAIILMLSSTDRQGGVSRCEPLGISGYLHKPIRQADLQAAILKALGSSTSASGRAHTRAADAPPTPRPLRILLAEDHPFNQKVAVLMMARNGHVVTTAVNGRETLAALRREAFDLVLMDVQMPEMDGFQATAAIRASEAGTGRHIPIIALTAHARPEDRERCRAAGMDGYVSKPIKEAALLEAIAEQIFGTPRRPGGASTAAVEFAMDVDAALARVDGDREFLGGMARMFLDDGPVLVDRIRRAIGPGDWPEIRQPAHTLKNWLGNFAAASAFEAARRLEDAACDRRAADVGPALSALERELERLARSLARLAPEPAPDAGAAIMTTPDEAEATPCIR